ncbi:hypothetical protein LTR33_012753, partial [Friedmanniomyces endolithicus]
GPYPDHHSLCERDKRKALLYIDNIEYYVDHANCTQHAVVKQLEALLELDVYEAIIHDHSGHCFDNVLPDAHVVVR